MIIDPTDPMVQQHLHKGPQIQLNNSNTELIYCSECNGTFFRQVLMMRKASKILVGGLNDQLIPIPILRCDDCGTPLEETLPTENG